MNEAADILRSYVRLVGRLSGAISASFYVPPGASGEPEILVLDGRGAPVSELEHPEAAADFHRSLTAEALRAHGRGPRLVSRTAGGILYGIPLRARLSRSDADARPERRRPVARFQPEHLAWLGLRFASEATQDHRDERWWKALLGLAAAFAVHSRTRTLLDPVTGLPDRAGFLSRLDDELQRGVETGQPVTLLLLGPDDFAWVNDRLDRRAGDRVLREVATGLRAALRDHDPLARYGGAVFAVILHGTSLAEGCRVAENVVRRLGERLYHKDILRLEFSAGLAVAEPAEPMDSQELIRRADQAVAAARRGDAGNVRVWAKGSDVEQAESLDRLQGIFTGDKSKDYRNMRLLLDSVAAVAAATDAAELARSFAERVIETLRARRVAVLGCARRGGFDILAGLERVDGETRAFRLTEADLALVEQARQERTLAAQHDDAQSTLCAMPLRLQDRFLGAIVVEIASPGASFEGSDRKFFDTLASAVAVALDRARLIERELARERLEKERLEAEVTDLRRVAHGLRFAYRSSTIASLLATVRKVARTDTTVLITGESGTGKEMLAHTIHEMSLRHARPLFVVDCSAIAPTLIDSEFFGHERGAFTGALARKQGRLAQADGATLFLDEIGDLPLDLQSKLLRFVQEKELTPVGGVAVREIDVRIIAATNVDLRARVAAGRFREDLFHRLNVVRLHVPPLRDRPDDIVHLANLFLKQSATLHHRPARRFTQDAEAALRAYAWPGNVRELENLVLTSALFSDAAEIDTGDLHGFPPSPDQPLLAPVASAGSHPQELESAVPELPADGDALPESARKLREALSAAVTAALAAGPRSVVPIGKWLTEDLVATAHRLSQSNLRRGAELLGLPETTYRRHVQDAARRRAAGLLVRPPWWPTVASVLEEVIMDRRGSARVCEWAETCLLSEIASAVPGDAPVAAALLGVTEPTFLRRKARPLRRS